MIKQTCFHSFEAFWVTSCFRIQSIHEYCLESFLCEYIMFRRFHFFKDVLWTFITEMKTWTWYDLKIIVGGLLRFEMYPKHAEFIFVTAVHFRICILWNLLSSEKLNPLHLFEFSSTHRALRWSSRTPGGCMPPATWFVNFLTINSINLSERVNIFSNKPSPKLLVNILFIR